MQDEANHKKLADRPLGCKHRLITFLNKEFVTNSAQKITKN